MNEYTFTVTLIYRTDSIIAETEEEAIEIVMQELNYNGEEIDTIIKLRYCNEQKSG